MVVVVVVGVSMDSSPAATPTLPLTFLFSGKLFLSSATSLPIELSKFKLNSLSPQLLLLVLLSVLFVLAVVSSDGLSWSCRSSSRNDLHLPTSFSSSTFVSKLFLHRRLEMLRGRSRTNPPFRALVCRDVEEDLTE